MKRILRVAVVTAFALVAGGARAWSQALDPLADAVSFACTNQAWIVYALGIAGAHLGFSVVSAALKKYGITEGGIVTIIRLLAIDVKPPAATIIKQAAAIQVANPGVSQ